MVGAFVAIPAIIMIIFHNSIPESPRWLICNKRDAEARAVIKMLRRADTPNSEIEAEIEAIQAELAEELQANGTYTHLFIVK